MRLGALVHYLDVGGVPVPEVAGFAAIMASARALAAGLLEHRGTVLAHQQLAVDGNRGSPP